MLHQIQFYSSVEHGPAFKVHITFHSPLPSSVSRPVFPLYRASVALTFDPCLRRAPPVFPASRAALGIRVCRQLGCFEEAKKTKTAKGKPRTRRGAAPGRL